jgi:3-hydroxyacyl-CoA dehydrogenase
MNDQIQYTIDGPVAIVVITNPPVNALGQKVRQGIVDAMTKAKADDEVEAIVLIGGGRTFPAGADIREFGGKRLEPGLGMVCDTIEDMEKPVVVAFHGTALGGGCEIALSAHYRLADATARIGLPEVNLGLLPGAGGTQRLTRIIGAQQALDIILSGKPINMKRAYDLGIVDAIVDAGVDGDLKSVAVDYAKSVTANSGNLPRTGEATKGLADVDGNQAAIAAARATISKSARGQYSPERIVDCVEVALTKPLREGLDYEAQAFLDCLATPQSQGMVHAFFADRRCAKIPEAGRAQPRKLDYLGVIGGGTMGSGITIAALKAGLNVTMVERDADSIARGIANVEKAFDRDVSKGRLDTDGKAAIMARYRPTIQFDDLADMDMVIEAVFENLDVKREVFAQLDKVVRKGAVLASNTSYLDIDKIAAATSRPQDVIGLHFFSPANIMKLLEIVIPSNPSDDAVATGFLLAKRMRKTAVRAGNCHGFIGNRILSVYGEQASYLLEDGASPQQIDGAVRDFGYPMGPFQMFDMAGLDIGWSNRKAFADTRDPNRRYVAIADRICENGWFGQKTGRGFYNYPDGSRIGVENPDLQAIIDAERAANNITPREMDADQIMRRYMAAMINEAANVVHEGIALRPSDVDVTLLYGYGFPRYRGGPMKYADMYGLDRLLDDIKSFQAIDPVFWEPSPLLVQLVQSGNNFDSLNTD